MSTFDTSTDAGRSQALFAAIGVLAGLQSEHPGAITGFHIEIDPILSRERLYIRIDPSRLDEVFPADSTARSHWYGEAPQRNVSREIRGIVVWAIEHANMSERIASALA